MDEYVESLADANRLREKVEQLSEAIGLRSPGEFGAEYIAHNIVNNGALDYRVFPTERGPSDYAVVDEMDGGGMSGICGGLSSGPTQRLQKNGFVIYDVTAYADGMKPHFLREEYDFPDAFVCVYISYVGKDHPIIEYWEGDDDGV